MANMKYYQNLWSTSDVADYLGVTVQTVSRYVRDGLLSATDLSTGTGRPMYGFHEYDVVDFTQRMKKVEHGKRVRYIAPNKKETKKTVVKKEVVVKDNTNEINELRAKVSALTEILFDVCVRLEALTK